MFGICNEGMLEFKDLFPVEEMCNVRCPNCEDYRIRLRTKTYNFENCKYLVFVLPMCYYKNEKCVRYNPRKIFNFNCNDVNIPGTKFRTIAGIIHNGESVNSGHYTVCLRYGNEWIIMGDLNSCEFNVSKNTRKRFIYLLENIYMLFLEKL